MLKKTLLISMILASPVAFAGPSVELKQDITVKPHQTATIRHDDMPKGDVIRMDCLLENPSAAKIDVKYTYSFPKSESLTGLIQTGTDFYSYQTNLGEGSNHLVGYFNQGKGLATFENLSKTNEFTIQACTFSVTDQA